MLAKRNLNFSQFKWTLATCLALACTILALSFGMGKIDLFLLLNNDLGVVADYFFKFITFGGDGIIWVGWLIYFLIRRTTRYLPLIIGSFVFLTIFTQLSKQVLLPDEPRPLLAIPNQQLVHYVKGVTVHSINSFPSGHTATAFLFLLLISLLSPKKWLVVFAFFVAVLVGYSRIYLGQHFPLDVGVGIIVAVISMLLAIQVQIMLSKK